MGQTSQAEILDRRADTRASSRIPELDSLRGIAALSVALFHLTAYHDQYPDLPFKGSAGHYGVELFFVISGFVIVMSLEKTSSVAAFANARFARLYPAYWVAVLFTTLVAHAFESAPPSAPVALFNLTMLQVFTQVPNVDYSYWTLAVELCFYIYMALLSRFDRLKNIETVMLYWCAMAFAFRWYARGHGIRVPEVLSVVTLLGYVQFFTLGICIYRWSAGLATRRTWLTIAVACAISLRGAVRSSLFALPLEYFGVTCGVFALVAFAVIVRPALLRLRALVFLGEVSYPLYLIHQRAGKDVIGAGKAAGYSAAVVLPATFAALIFTAYLIHRFSEVPGRRWLRRDTARTSGSP